MNKLLIIDDDKGLTELLSDYLSQQGFDVRVANNPLEGIELINKVPHDLLLLDVMMPEIDGFEALKRIRTFSSIPVIMLTAKGDDFDKILGLELGADDYLPKPFNQRELVARIKALIRRLNPSTAFNQPQKVSLHGVDINEANQAVIANGNTIEMTSTEFLLLAYLMKNVGNLQSKEVLSEKVLSRK